MAYNPDKDKSAGYISPKHYDLLESLYKRQKPPVTKRAMLEHIIEQAAAKGWGSPGEH